MVQCELLNWIDGSCPHVHSSLPRMLFQLDACGQCARDRSCDLFAQGRGDGGLDCQESERPDDDDERDHGALQDCPLASCLGSNASEIQFGKLL